jgi:Protein of unknown function (DUF3551)
MRNAIVLMAAAAVVTAISAGSAHAQGWCSYSTGPKALVDCGYSSNTDCENAAGKGGLCFPDPEYALNSRRGTAVASRSAAGAS